MGHSLPLQDYAVIKTRDVDEARESIARYFWRHRLDLEGKSTDFDARLHHAPSRLKCAMYRQPSHASRLWSRDSGP